MEKLFINIAFKVLSKRDCCIGIIKFLAFLRSFYITDFSERKAQRDKWFEYYRTHLYGAQVLHTAKEVGEGFWCNEFSYVNENTILKDHVHFNGMNITGSGNVTIGRYFHSGIENLIITQTHDYDYGDNIPYGSEMIHSDIEIGDFVWFGSRVTILPHTHIGEGAIIQAGSVVHGEIPPMAIAGGNPAKVFKYRDVEHFEKLKSEGKFL